jgi:DNA recombination protein RmuC
LVGLTLFFVFLHKQKKKETLLQFQKEEEKKNWESVLSYLLDENNREERLVEQFKEQIKNQISEEEKNIKNDLFQFQMILQNTITSSIDKGSQNQMDNLKLVSLSLSQSMDKLVQSMQDFRMETETKLAETRKTLQSSLEQLNQNNNEKLSEIRQTVDERLQKTLDERLQKSFASVAENLRYVQEGLGEMKSLATGVGDIKKVLSNVKTRGIYGEIALGGILSDLLTPDQYAVNVITKPHSTLPVEYAVILPGSDNRKVYLPIDSKFPLNCYQDLMTANDSGDLDAIKLAKASFATRIKSFAKDIHDKYIEVPYTTEFGLMFLPTESIYAEVVSSPIAQEIQKNYKISPVGPSTLAAYLNSLQMGFRTLAIQKRSSEVWTALASVKTEFEAFGDVLKRAQNRIQQAGDEIEALVGVRSRQMAKKLKDAEKLNLIEERINEGETNGN